jgi:hypothetical protein
MDSGVRFLLAVGLGAMLLAEVGCSKTRADVGEFDEVAYQEAVAVHDTESAALDELYQERYDLLAEYRREIDVLCSEDREWVEAEKQEVEEARKLGEAAYLERRNIGFQHFYARCDESRKKRDVITASYIPRVKEVNDRLDTQEERVAAARASLDRAKRHH